MRDGSRRSGRGVAAIDSDVEAGLVELFFHVDLAGGLQGQEPGAHPGDFRNRQALLADVDGGAGEMGRGHVAIGGSGVAVDFHQGTLEGDSADSGVDLQRTAVAGVVDAGEVGEEAGGPRTAVAAVQGQVGVDAQRDAGGNGNELVRGFEIVELGFVLNADQAFGRIALILAEKRGARAAQGRNKAKMGEAGGNGVCRAGRGDVRGDGAQVGVGRRKHACVPTERGRDGSMGQCGARGSRPQMRDR